MFYETEILLREQLKYPPFCDIILFSFNSLIEEELISTSDTVYKYLKQNLDENEFKVFKPMPSPIDKIQGRYRWRIIVKGNMTKNIYDIFNDCLKSIYSFNLKSTRVSIDVNPNSMM